MAEGVQVASFNSRYFCYQCNREVSVIQSTELACPECSSDFLEEVDLDMYPDYEEESDADESELNMLNLLSIDNLFRRTVMNIVGEEAESPRQLSEDSYDDTDAPDELQSMRNALQTLQLQMIESGRFRPYGDYLYQEDIDALSTMLLNEAEISGPPPLPKEQIKLLPVITVSKEHIEKGVQCTICMDDFCAREKAKSLPCEHFYHEQCITPWLERHATCPNCRKIVEIQSKNRRSQSCPRTEINSRTADQRRYSESSTSLSDFFSTSMNPFRFL